MRLFFKERAYKSPLQSRVIFTTAPCRRLSGKPAKPFRGWYLYRTFVLWGCLDSNQKSLSLQESVFAFCLYASVVRVRKQNYSTNLADVKGFTLGRSFGAHVNALVNAKGSKHDDQGGDCAIDIR